MRQQQELRQQQNQQSTTEDLPPIEEGAPSIFSLHVCILITYGEQRQQTWTLYVFAITYGERRQRPASRIWTAWILIKKNKSHFNNDSLLYFLFMRLLCKYSCSLDEYFVVFFSLKKEQMFVCFNYIIFTFLGAGNGSVQSRENRIIANTTKKSTRNPLLYLFPSFFIQHTERERNRRLLRSLCLATLDTFGIVSCKHCLSRNV